ncbi:thiol peroxidase [Kyrpidia spormannii]|uniref:Thiol peroxidase n=1 Tax=Kyrpidia spormannii TaxID=2055160 RepID=A0A6F9EI08_9BACL|nr:thiol peroxidase [Kyrpidia spormannii]CAB3396122.1 Thiol peroxidase [Kyrpidia spormannii]
MEERPGAVNFKGNPVTLVGPEVRRGDVAKPFTVFGAEMRPYRLEDGRGRVRVFSVVPSVSGSGACSIQMKRFFDEALQSPDIDVITVSVDLPPTQQRWLEAAGQGRMQVYSDYRDLSFGHAFGVVIKELRMLTRSVFVLDREDRILYAEVVPDVAQVPSFERVMEAAKQAVPR